MKIKLAIVDKDQDYLDRLCAIFSSKYSDRLEVYPYTDLEVAVATLDFIKADVLLVEESFRVNFTLIPEKCAFAYFVNSVGQDMLNGKRAICRYQKAELICKQVMGLFAETADHLPAKNLAHNEAKIIAFMSPAGGVGVSTLTAACAQSLASGGKKVLYLNLETYGETSDFFHASGNADMSDIIHALKNKNTNLAMLLEDSARKDAKGVRFYCDAASACDMLSLTQEDISRLIRELKITASYDYIVIDLPFSIETPMLDAFRRMNAIVFVSDGNDRANRKLMRAYHALSSSKSVDSTLFSKFYILYNKFDPIRGRNLTELNDTWKDAGSIPFMQARGEDALLSKIASLELFQNLC